MLGRRCWIKHLALLSLFLGSCLSARAQDDNLEKLKAKPITTVPGKVGDLLREWWKEGTAAGNVGDFYDNRDRDHSPLNQAQFPQLQRIAYSADDLKVRKDWAGQRVIVPGVVFGNSSTSAPPRQGGSNIRMYYTNTKGLDFLYKQYTSNNVYIYPEHRDHDPGHNGQGDGFGDLYPTNTPYLFTSQGSSGSDQNFMRALPLTLAAFRPEVKKKLTESGLLMPTLQMIFRSTYRPPSEHGKPRRGAADYLPARSHPTVFEPAWVDELGMVQLAHELRLESLPPMIQLKVDSEDQPIMGRDYFDVHRTEVLANTPAVIARIVRGKDQVRKMVVSAAKSYDLNKKPLTFTWVVLRGDPKRVTITARNKDQSEVEIQVAYHERRPIAVGSPMESNRVDVGVFAHNGTHFSAPGFVTFYSLDDEARTYDEQGRILEIGYGMGQTIFNVSNWNAFLTLATGDDRPARMLNLKEEELQTLQKALVVHKKLHEALEAQRPRTRSAEDARNQAKTDETLAQKGKTQAEKDHQDRPSATTKTNLEKAVELLAETVKAHKQAEKLAQKARQDQDAAERAIRDLLDGKTKDVPVSVRALVDRHLHALSQDPEFLETVSVSFKDTPSLLAKVALTRVKLLELGMFSEDAKAGFKPLRPGMPPRWTAFEKAQIERCNASIVSALFPGCVDSSFDANFVDQRLSVARTWRDVYHYDDKGGYRGWTRYEGKEPRHFTAAGLLILKKDSLERPLETRTVDYRSTGNSLRMIPGDTLITFEYAGPEDRQGTVKSKRPAPKK